MLHHLGFFNKKCQCYLHYWRTATLSKDLLEPVIHSLAVSLAPFSSDLLPVDTYPEPTPSENALAFFPVKPLRVEKNTQQTGVAAKSVPKLRTSITTPRNFTLFASTVTYNTYNYNNALLILQNYYGYEVMQENNLQT